MATVLAGLLFLVQAVLAGTGPVRGPDEIALDRMLGVICDGANGPVPEQTPLGEHDGHGTCCPLGCSMAGGSGIATLPDLPQAEPLREVVLATETLTLSIAGVPRAAPHAFGARAPPSSTI